MNNCDTFLCIKRSNIKYGKFPDKEAGEITRNKNMCGSSSYLHHNRTGKEIEFKSKSRYHDIPCNKVVPNNAI